MTTVGTFAVASWDEKPVHEVEGTTKLARASVTFRYEGELSGEGTAEYLLAYPTNAEASCVGLQRIVGTLAGRSGSFILRHDATVSVEGVVTDAWEVVRGSGTGELAGLRGTGGFSAGHDPDLKAYPMTLDYRFE